MSDENIEKPVEIVEAPQIEAPEPTEKPEPRKSLRDELKENVKAAKEKQENPDKEIAPKPIEKIAKADRNVAKPEKPVIEKIAAPEAIPADIKAEWEKLSSKAQQALIKREADIHKGMTTMDEERSFAKEMQKSIMPYMPLINASGSTPAKAITELLNYAQILQYGTPQSKSQLLHQLAQRWGADLRVTPQVAQQPAYQLQSVQQELQQTKQQLAQLPELIKQQQEQAKLMTVIETFAADPKNTHYEKVKPVMASLLSSGNAKDMQDAYDKACFADPDIRSTLLLEQEKAKEAKRIADLKARTGAARSAAVSIKGGSAVNGMQPPKVNRSLREELMHNFRAATNN